MATQAISSFPYRQLNHGARLGSLKAGGYRPGTRLPYASSLLVAQGSTMDDPCRSRPTARYLP
jgi:hypothetical protein